MIGPEFPSVALATGLIPGQLEVFKDVKPTEFKISDLKFIPFLKKKEKNVEGEELCRRAVKLHANLGLVDARRILAHRTNIPASLQDKQIIFTGTKLHRRICFCESTDNPSDVLAGVLVWRKEWYLDYHFLSGNWTCYFTNCDLLPCVK